LQEYDFGDSDPTPAQPPTAAPARRRSAPEPYYEPHDPTSDRFDVDEFVRDGGRVIDERADARATQRLAPVVARIERMAEAYVARHSSDAKKIVQESYNKFNRDPAFVSNKQVQAKVKDGLKGMLRDAEYRARAFQDFSGYEAFSHPHFAAGVLQVTKATLGLPPGDPALLQTPGGEVQGVSSRQNVGPANDLDEDTRDALRRAGIKPEDYTAALEKYGDDIEFS
jgi:hypothetical protein